MGIANTAESWGWLARALHWALAVLIVFQLVVGLYMVQVIGGDLIARFGWTQTHKSWGFVVFVLVLVRIVWRLANPTPRAPEMPGWQAAASRASHLALYLLMIGLPLTGWLMASASPYNDADAYVRIENQVTLQYLFGKATLDALGLKEAVLLTMPDPFQPGDEALTELLSRIHLAFGLALAAILGLHVAAALKHEFVDRDGLLRRMLRGR